MRVLRLLAVGFVALVAVEGAHALAVTFAFTAHVTDDPFGLSSFGAPISGDFTFDSGATDSTPNPATGSYALWLFTGALLLALRRTRGCQESLSTSRHG